MGACARSVKNLGALPYSPGVGCGKVMTGWAMRAASGLLFDVGYLITAFHDHGGDTTVFLSVSLIPALYHRTSVGVWVLLRHSMFGLSDFSDERWISRCSR